MARNPAAQTAFGPMMLAALEQNEPPERRLVDDDLAARFLPAPTRWLVTATPPKLMQRLMMHAIERSGPGMWANFVCRKRYVGDKITEALDDIDAIVVLGAGLDTLAYRLARQTRIPIFEADQPVNIERKAAAVRRVLGELPSSVRLVPLDFERDDVLTALTGLGYRTDYRTFFVWEAVTQYLSADAVHATLESLRPAASGSRLVFTYVRRDFLDGINFYGAKQLYQRFRKRQQLWRFGLLPEEVAAFLDGHGWRLIEQLGPEEIVRRYVEPTGRNLTASQIEWSAYAEKA
jgi:methyltransferase (TIGR00027 family)